MAWVGVFSPRSFCDECGNRVDGAAFCGACGAGEKRARVEPSPAVIPSAIIAEPGTATVAIPGVSPVLFNTIVAILSKLELDQSRPEEHKQRIADVALKRATQLAIWTPRTFSRAAGAEERPSDFGCLSETISEFRDGVFVTKSKTKLLKIHSMAHWQACFGVYMYAMVSVHPSLGAGLSQHLNMVNGFHAIGRHSFSSIYDTEALHRQRYADGSLVWGENSRDIAWSNLVIVSGASSALAASASLVSSYSSTAPSSGAGRGSRADARDRVARAPRAPSSSPYPCKRFNELTASKACPDGTACVYQHVCMLCKEAGHVQGACKRNRDIPKKKS